MSFQLTIKILQENWPMFLRGALTTLQIAIISTIIGTSIGLIVGTVKTIPIPEKGFSKVLLKTFNALISAYVEIFRATPMIVQSMVIYYGSSAAFGWNLNKISAAIFIVSINTGAYMSEIVRGGIVSIDTGQFEAGSAIGMSHFQTMRYVVIPQVVRNILPATGNEFIINIKDTSVLSVIGVAELFFQSRTVAGANYRYFETFFITCVIYFIMTFTITRILRSLEKRLDGPKDYIILGNQMQVERSAERKILGKLAK